ncbi:MAG: hypothetical protein GVY12_00630 [Bacteroidetes bacterium]|nr:hypothetical protein [Bacteroidota bacterium]
MPDKENAEIREVIPPEVEATTQSNQQAPAWAQALIDKLDALSQRVDRLDGGAKPMPADEVRGSDSGLGNVINRQLASLGLTQMDGEQTQHINRVGGTGFRATGATVSPASSDRDQPSNESDDERRHEEVVEKLDDIQSALRDMQNYGVAAVAS